MLEIKDAAAESVNAGTLGVYLAGMVVAAVVGYICIKALLIVVRGKKFKYFFLVLFRSRPSGDCGAFSDLIFCSHPKRHHKKQMPNNAKQIA